MEPGAFVRFALAEQHELGARLAVEEDAVLGGTPERRVGRLHSASAALRGGSVKDAHALTDESGLILDFFLRNGGHGGRHRTHLDFLNVKINDLSV